jgi:hypothetical protein
MPCVQAESVCFGASVCADDGTGATECTPIEVVRDVGGRCDEEVYYCSPAEGLACLNRICMASRPAGGPLGAGCERGDYSAPCDPGLYCKGEEGARTCQAKVADGAPCDEYDACLDGACDLGVCRPRACSAI